MEWESHEVDVGSFETFEIQNSLLVVDKKMGSSYRSSKGSHSFFLGVKFGRTRRPNLGLTSSAIPHSWLSFLPLTGDHWQPFGVSLVVALLLLLVLLLFPLDLLLLELQLLHIDNPLVSGAQKDSHCQTIGISPQLQICAAQALNWTAEFWTSISRTDWSQMFARAAHCRALNGCSAGRDKHR